MLKKLLCVMLIAQAALANAQSLWSDLPEQNIPRPNNARRDIVPKKYRTVRLDLVQLQPVLATAPDRFTSTGADNETILTLPMPDGSRERFRLSESPVMEASLQAKFPDIRCYTGTGIDDPSATLKCDLTPHGFHAMIQSEQRGITFIDPYQRGDRDHYVVYFKRDFQSKKEPFHCELDGSTVLTDKVNGVTPDGVADCMFRQYRLALACTGEYATFHGGTVALTLAAMNTTINRVNGIYERDFATTLKLINNNNLLVFLDPATDGYSNGNPTAMLNQNQTKCNTVIGSANYDIGHVFGTSGGGVASLGVVCGNSVKARGVTGISQPAGDPFDVDYVAHEIGHQFGANHSFNNTCDGNINAGTAFEPGSGTTIMAYAGVCNPNVQPNSDAYFHATSLQEIGAYISAGQGNVCPVKVNVGNASPTVNAGADYIIPRATPFALTATGNDANGHPLTYCWEQMDNQQAPAPPLASNTAGPLFRSFFPSGSPTRYFPRLEDLIANTDPLWEQLPGVARTLNFRVTARDNFIGGGCTGEDNMTLTVAGTAGPFVVTNPNTPLTWYVGESKTITWDVANTNLAPVNCTQVRILLSTDGGYTYPVVLADGLPNNGSAVIEVANQVSDSCRIMVQAVGNVFFDISNENFEIAPPLSPTFLLNISSGSAQVCSGENLSLTATVTGISGFSDPVELTVTGAPAGANVQINPNPVIPGNSAEITLSGLTVPGAYTLTIEGVSDTITRTRTVELVVLDQAPPTPVLSSPADGSGNALPNQSLGWAAIPDVQFYQLQVATNPSFDPAFIIFDQTLTQAEATLAGLDTASVYYWRVMAVNACGQSPFSTVFAFQTGRPECGFTFVSNNIPIAIPDNDIATVASALDIPNDRIITDLNLKVKADHTWVGDLAARLVSPWGESASLFDQPGFPVTSSGCNGDNLDLTFDDEAIKTAADLENTCNDLPALSGAFKSLEPLNRFDNRTAQGAWTLEMNDNFPEDGGAITAWSLEVCFSDTVQAGQLLVNEQLTVLVGSPGDIGVAHLFVHIASGNADEGIFTLLSVPEHGTLTLDGLPLGVGGTFTQDDILAGSVSYTHNADAATADSFRFDALDNGSNAWVHDSVFRIRIIQNDLVVTSEVSAGVLCNGGNEGQITVAVTGGTPPFQYSLNGSPFQSGNTFSNLIAGEYTVVVRDQNGFTAESGVITLTDPPLLLFITDVKFDDVTVLASGGTGALEYSIDGQNFQPGNVFQNLPNGNYTVTVRDANGCTATGSALVDVPLLDVQADLLTPLACAGNADGVITAAATGGVPPLSYSLNGVDYQAGNVFGGLPAGTYTITVKDDSGNTATSNAVILSDPPAIQVTTSVSDDDITVTATGGTGSLEYSTDGQNYQSSNFFENLPNGFYTLTVRDANGCTASAEAAVAVDELLAELKISSLNPCAGDNKAAVSSKAAGGVAPYTYSLNGVDFQQDSLFDGLAAGVYTVVVKDDSGNTATTNVVSVIDPPALNISADDNLNILTVTASGGTGALQYSIDGENFQSGNTFGNLANGNYTVTVRDANGCTATATAIIAVPALKILEVLIEGIACYGQTGQLIVFPGGGIPPYQYSLDGAAFQNDSIFTGVGAGIHSVSIKDAVDTIVTLQAINVTEPDPLVANVALVKNDVQVVAGGGTVPYLYSLNGGPQQSNGIFDNLPNGTYTVVVTDANGCTTSAGFTVDYQGLVAIALPANPSCTGFADGSVLVNTSGGTPPYLIQGPVSDLPAGTYTLIVADFTGDTVHVTFTLFDPLPLIAIAEVNKDTITISASGGTGNLMYSLDGIIFQNSPVFSGLPNGTYQVWVSDQNGCITTVENLVVDVIGTVEPAQAWGLAVQPNPSAGIFRITLKNVPGGRLRADVFDTAGRLLLEQVHEPVNNTLAATLELTGFPPGVYWLRLTSGGQTGAVRLVIQ